MRQFSQKNKMGPEALLATAVTLYLLLVRHILGLLQYKNAVSIFCNRIQNQKYLANTQTPGQETFTDAICGVFCVLISG